MKRYIRAAARDVFIFIRRNPVSERKLKTSLLSAIGGAALYPSTDDKETTPVRTHLIRPKDRHKWGAEWVGAATDGFKSNSDQHCPLCNTSMRGIDPDTITFFIASPVGDKFQGAIVTALCPACVDAPDEEVIDRVLANMSHRESAAAPKTDNQIWLTPYIIRPRDRHRFSRDHTGVDFEAMIKKYLSEHPRCPLCSVPIREKARDLTLFISVSRDQRLMVGLPICSQCATADADELTPRLVAYCQHTIRMMTN